MLWNYIVTCHITKHHKPPATSCTPLLMVSILIVFICVQLCMFELAPL